MAVDLSVTKIIDFIVGDFEDAWDGLAARQGNNFHRGNFLFGRQAMSLLEVACRLCYSDSTGQALRDLSHELALRESRYFTQFPGSCWTPGKSPEFYLPRHGPNPEWQLIAALFDLVRNGQAHQYQQIRVRLADSKDFSFALTGAEHGLFLRDAFARGRPPEHLKACKDNNGDIWMTVRTDILFLDIHEAVSKASLLSRNLTLNYLTRPKGTNSPYYQFSSVGLETQLQGAGHF